MNKNIRILTIPVLLLLVFAAPVKGEERLADFAIRRPKTKVKAPPFTLNDLAGHETKLEDFKGRVVVVNFWASWCKPCRVEMPSLSRLSNKFRDKGLIFLAIAVDRGFFTNQNVKKFLKKYGLNLPVLMDRGGHVRKAYEVTMLPTTFIIGRDGFIIGRGMGERVWDGEEAEKFFSKLME